MKTLKDLGYVLAYEYKGEIRYEKRINVSIGGHYYERLYLYNNGNVEIATADALLNQELAKAIEIEMKKLGWWA